MNKKYVVILMALFILLVLAIPAQATKPDSAEGVWSYFVYKAEVKEAGCNTFLTTYDYGKMTGTFEGETTEVGMVVEHCSGGVSFNGNMVFVGEVDSPAGARSGTMEMSVVGQCCDENGWDGQWVILSGTEELANLRGQGTWSGPGAGGPFVWGDVDYEGNIHFEGND
ncbi:MAG: hypothetical protein ACK2UR_08705 [Candidatus Promineifilaceae bacterium]